MSGFFLQHKTVEGLDVYPEQMKNVFEMSNATYGVNQACIASMNASEQWQCNFAQHAYVIHIHIHIHFHFHFHPAVSAVSDRVHVSNIGIFHVCPLCPLCPPPLPPPPPIRYAHTTSPTFPLNSALDYWQTMCIYASELPPGWPSQRGTENGVCDSAKVRLNAINRIVADIPSELDGPWIY